MQLQSEPKCSSLKLLRKSATTPLFKCETSTDMNTGYQKLNNHTGARAQETLRGEKYRKRKTYLIARVFLLQESTLTAV